MDKETLNALHIITNHSYHSTREFDLCSILISFPQKEFMKIHLEKNLIGFYIKQTRSVYVTCKYTFIGGPNQCCHAILYYVVDIGSIFNENLRNIVEP